MHPLPATPAAAAAFLLLALAALGCSTSPDDGNSPAVEELSTSIEAAPPTTTAQPGAPATTNQPESPPTSTTTGKPEPPATTNQPESPPTSTTTGKPEPPATTNQPERSEPLPTTPDDTGTEPEAATDLEPSTPADNNGETTSDAGEPVTRISADRLLPWGDGLLQVGYPIVGEDREDRTRLFARVSADGLNWSPPARLFVPLPEPTIHDASRWDDFIWPYVVTFGTSPEVRINDALRWSRLRFVLSARSDGKRLILAMHQGADLFAAITGDLTHWEVHKIPPPSSDGLPSGVEAATHSRPGLAVGPEGWLIYRRVALRVDPWVIAPADIRESAQDIYLRNPDYVDGKRVEGEPLGLEIEWRAKQHEPADPYSSRFVTWEELGIDEDTYRHYGIEHYANKPYIPSWLVSGEVWVAEWGNNPVRHALPTVRGGFWDRVVGTDAGYVGLPWPAEAGYLPDVGASTMFFSADGTTWDRIHTPGGDRVTLDYLTAVENGILVVGEVSEEPYYSPIRSQLWLADATGSDWRPVDMAGLPERSWIEIYRSGHGVVGRSGLTEDDRSVQWIVGSINGVDWLVMEHADPRYDPGWQRRMTIIGDAMLVTDGEGNTQRSVIP
jgi:hypothetical protein